jgi:hypothetical protein
MSNPDFAGLAKGAERRQTDQADGEQSHPFEIVHGVTPSG